MITGVVMAVVVSVVGATFFGWYGFTASGRRRLMSTRPPARILTPSPEGVRAQRRMWILVCQGLCLLLVFAAVGTVVFTLTGNL